jgi:hypothetical protein
MRVVAYGFVALALGTIASGPAAAQCYGPECDSGRRDGPPAYYTDRPPQYRSQQPPQWDEPGRPRSRDTGPNVDRPAYRSAPDNRETQYGRPGDAPPRWPAESDRGDRPPDPSSRRAGPPPPSESDRRMWDERNSPPARSTVMPPPAPRDVAGPQPRRPGAADDPRSAAGSGKVTISIAEYRALQDQARELQRLLARRGEVQERGNVPQERGNAPEERDGRPRGDFRERSDMREGSGPRTIYR